MILFIYKVNSIVSGASIFVILLHAVTYSSEEVPGADFVMEEVWKTQKFIFTIGDFELYLLRLPFTYLFPLLSPAYGVDENGTQLRFSVRLQYPDIFHLVSLIAQEIKKNVSCVDLDKNFFDFSHSVSALFKSPVIYVFVFISLLILQSQSYNYWLYWCFFYTLLEVCVPNNHIRFFFLCWSLTILGTVLQNNNPQNNKKNLFISYFGVVFGLLICILAPNVYCETGHRRV